MTCAPNATHATHDMPGTGRSMAAGWLAAVAAAVPGGALGGLLCACILSLAAIGQAWPTETFRPEMVWKGLLAGLWPVSLVSPAMVVLAHLATRGMPRRWYAMAVGWTGFVSGGIAPFLLVPGYDMLPCGLVAGMACAWAFEQAGGRVRDGG